MRRFCLLSVSCLILQPNPTAAERDTSIYKTDVGVYKTEPHIYKNAAGMPTTPVTCALLMNRQWSFTSLGAATYCEDAIRACAAEALMREHLKEPLYKGETRGMVQADLERAQEYSIYYVKACQLAIDAHNYGFTNVLDYAGRL